LTRSTAIEEDASRSDKEREKKPRAGLAQPYLSGYNQAPREGKEERQMRKVKILGAAFVAVLAFGVISAASASANQWLKNGAAITAKESAVTEGTWEITASTLFGGKITMECKGKLVGTVGPGTEDAVTSATDSNGNKLIDCLIKTNTTPCMKTLTLVEAEHLPWKTELLEPKAGEIIDHFSPGLTGTEMEPAFLVKCELSTGSFTSELCEGNVLTEKLVNLTAGVDGKLSKQMSKKCKGFGNSAEIAATGETKLLSGTLSVS
jgi:hypothetical protein